MNDYLLWCPPLRDYTSDSLTELQLALLAAIIKVGFAGFYCVLRGFIGFYWVLLGFTGFYWVLLCRSVCWVAFLFPFRIFLFIHSASFLDSFQFLKYFAWR